MGCGVYWQQIHEVERALGTMEQYGFDPSSEAYQKVYGARIQLLPQIGRKQPKLIIWLAKIFGFSPGTITLWEDIESGWMTEARAKPGAPPVYHYVSDETAMKVLKGELSHEEFTQLLVPDPYIGE